VTSPIDAELAAQEHLAAQREEYGQFVAAVPIYHGNALAFDVGHPVPATNVATYGYEANKLVTRVATKKQAREGSTLEAEQAAPPAADEDASVPNTGRTSRKQGS
jgi:hypothetical protein